MTAAEITEGGMQMDAVGQLRQRLAARKVASVGVPTPEAAGSSMEYPDVAITTPPVAIHPNHPGKQQPLASSAGQGGMEKGPQVHVSVRVEPERRARWQGYAAQRTVVLKNAGSGDRVTVQDIILEAMDAWEKKYQRSVT